MNRILVIPHVYWPSDYVNSHTQAIFAPRGYGCLIPLAKAREQAGGLRCAG